MMRHRGIDIAKYASKSADRLLSVGHRLIDLAMEQALLIESSVCVLANVEWPLFVCRVFDRVTTGQGLRQSIICGIEVCHDTLRSIADWELLKLLNASSPFALRSATVPEFPEQSSLVENIAIVSAAALKFVEPTGAQFRQPDVDIVCCFVPQGR